MEEFVTGAIVNKEKVMQLVLNLLVYLAVGAVGGFIGAKTKLPCGVLLGAVVAVMITKIITGQSWEVPKAFDFGSQVILGVLIALTYKPGMFQGMSGMLAAIVGSTLVLSIAGIIMALLLRRWGMMDLPTGYIATNPGGMSALVPLAIDLDVNAALIAQFHFFRIIFITLTAPFIFKWIIK